MKYVLSILMIGLMSVTTLADWDEGDPFKMHWPQLPDLMPTGMDVLAGPLSVPQGIPPYEKFLADDFQCTEDGPITSIHIWGSYNEDLPLHEVVQYAAFSLVIYSDIPAEQSPTGYSMPGDVLWETYMEPTAIRIYAENLSESFYDPNPNEIIGLDTVCWQYNFEIPEQMAFFQTAGEIYWLGIHYSFDLTGDGIINLQDLSVFISNYPGSFGWKTSVDHFNDDAVYTDVMTWGAGPHVVPNPFIWGSMQYPPGHEMEGQGIDLAFVINGPEPPPEDLDYGDALDPPYQTLLANDGARHYPGGPWLGDASDAPDFELDGQPHPTAKGDDGNGIDDENGVSFSTMVVGQNATVTFELNGMDANVDGWIDFDNDGVWSPSDQVVSGIWTVGIHSVSFTVPAGSTVGQTFARFRTSTDPAVDNIPFGMAMDGEVEDYSVTIEEPEPEFDFGDAPDPFAGAAGEYPTLLANDGARHVPIGPWLGDQSDAPDPEFEGQQDPAAIGDDTYDGNDDEDGVSFSILVQGQLATVTFEVNGAGAVAPGADVIGWLDFNADGKWDPSEKIVGGSFADGIHSLPFSVPPAAAVGPTFARFRISTDPAAIANTTGLAPDGEVEDHEVWIEEAPQVDVKWEQLPDFSLSGLHAHDYSDPDGTNYTQIIYADDWLCEGGVVTDFHWWGFEEAPGAGLAGFHLSIHANDPSGSCLPQDPPLWQKNVPLSDITVTWTGTFYRYDYDLQPEDYFYQIEGQTYWFDVSALSVDPGNACLWIWAEHGMPVLCPAADKVLPTLPVWQSNGNNMAFRVTSDSSIELMDFGDAPDQPYPTLLGSNGARHLILGPWLGDAADGPDAEGNGQQDPAALGDDNDGNDDEDGVSIPVMNQGISTTIGVLVSGGGGVVDAWVDWDGSGSWDASEQIHNAWLPDGPAAIVVTPPTTAVVGQTFARFRISTVGGLPPVGPAPDGEVEDHAVYIETGPQADLGDAPDSTNSYGIGNAMMAYPDGTQGNYPTVFSIGSPPHGPIHWSPLSAVWLGPAVTLEDEADSGLDQDAINNIDPPINVADQDGADDGLHLPVNMPRCKWTNVNYDVMVVDPVQIYYVNIWCDFNRDGDWDDQVGDCPRGAVPEWAVRNQILVGLPAGLNTVTSLPFVSWHPVDGVPELWMRITISEQPWQEIWGIGAWISGGGGCGPANGYDVGETEDYLVVPDTSCVACADLDCSGFVDLLDLSIFAQQWLSSCP